MNFNEIKGIRFAKTLVVLAVAQLGLSSCGKNEPEKEDYSARPVTESSSKYISKIYEYMPAPGQFMNEGIGTPEAAQSLVGKARAGLLSLGGYGGYVVFGFDHSVANGTGADIGIYGNPLTASDMEWSEPAIVMVMQDINNNGLPDDGEWFELAGSEYNKTETIKNYEITYYNPGNLTDDVRWTDNQGKAGHILRNSFHGKAYYPLWIKNQEKITFKGTLLKNTLEDGPILKNRPFEWGYADNGSEDYKTLIESMGEPYNSFDISHAVDAKGNPVKLTAVDFVKVYTAQNSNGSLNNPDKTTTNSRYVGEISAEIGGAVDLKLHLNKK